MKPDSEQFRTFLTNLAEAEWVKRTERRWWPGFIFHHTDIRNAVRILQDECLYSRDLLVARKALPVSSGSDLVLAATDERVKNCVRFYFRPQTPTQYHAEGVRSQKARISSPFPDAHCPVPIFFLFDAASVLSLDNCLFSDRNLASHGYRLFSTASELATLDWQKIYHTGPIHEDRPLKAQIISRRSAEIIVPHSLDLTALRFIYCRSEAEKETLLHYLPSPLYQKYKKRIVASARSNLYFKQHTYVETARLDSERAVLQFSPDTQSPGPFHLQVKLTVDSKTYARDQMDFALSGSYKLNIRTGSKIYEELEVLLDGHVVYANSFVESIEDDIPF